MYTEDQIKAAFWAMFHESGELWFPYKSADSEPVTAEEFRVFMEHLNEVGGQAKAGPNV